MDLTADLGAAIKRIEDLAKNLFENGAPHQKEHAADLVAVVEATKAGPGAPAAQAGDYDAVAAQLKIAQDNLTAEMAKTDTANAMVKTLQGQLSESETVSAGLQAELAAAKAPSASEDTVQKAS